MRKLSIIIPVLNEAENIHSVLNALQNNDYVETIVVDGGSDDNTYEVAKNLADKALLSPQKGRAIQMNLGANNASGDVLLFLHADTRLPNSFFQQIEKVIQSDKNVWGRFDVALTGEAVIFKFIAFMMNCRSKFTGIATGDQAIFVRKKHFDSIGGFENIPLMEDVAFSKSMKKLSKPVCIKARATTSSRRWEENGIFKTIVLMWKLRLAYFLGANPETLVKKYYQNA